MRSLKITSSHGTQHDHAASIVERMVPQKDNHRVYVLPICEKGGPYSLAASGLGTNEAQGSLWVTQSAITALSPWLERGPPKEKVLASVWSQALETSCQQTAVNVLGMMMARYCRDGRWPSQWRDWQGQKGHIARPAAKMCQLVSLEIANEARFNSVLAQGKGHAQSGVLTFTWGIVFSDITKACILCP